MATGMTQPSAAASGAMTSVRRLGVGRGRQPPRRADHFHGFLHVGKAFLWRVPAGEDAGNVRQKNAVMDAVVAVNYRGEKHGASMPTGRASGRSAPQCGAYGCHARTP